ncbi:S41 family peptidase [Pedobacter duraquae]|uniref:Peptidase S41-like protein n=1 Tax=Pedobacter duraquae TaxID=425511 RepID=A0A4R6IKS1_9SPHI|nr:S41 family peptidase [Pedobacter duraquae]TDO22631.1 peptidase S41-like protein [Pedobacter duraquae]
MKTNRGARSWMLVLAVTTAAGLGACKKTTPTPDPVTPVGPPSTGSRAELTKDSIFLYAKQVYLWNDALPSYGVFNPRQYTSASTDLANYNAELLAITKYKINPATNAAYEYRASDPSTPKYSNIQDLSNKNPVAVIAPLGSVNTDGDGYDIGIYSLYPVGNSDNDYQVYIRAVSPGSSAAAKGLTRGTRITAVNGKSIGTDFQNERTVLNTLTGNTITSATLSGFKTDGTPFTETLNRTSYKSSPVYKSKVFTQSGKKVGYLSFARFSALTASGSDANLDPVFADFAAQGITDLIIDLRYNGGGYVSTAEYLVNLIAPSSAKGTMYVEKYNTSMQANSAESILKNQPLVDANGKLQYSSGKLITYANVDYSIAGNTAVFNKKGSLNGVTNVVFIVSGSTASASELTINALKPFVNVKLVGTQTYGKPVGFFPITIENHYDVYYSMFETVNSKGEGGYYAGFTPDVVDAFDDCFHDFDNPLENYVAKSLNLLAPATAKPSASVVASINASRSLSTSSATANMTGKLEGSGRIIGMVETRHKLKK